MEASEKGEMKVNDLGHRTWVDLVSVKRIYIIEIELSCPLIRFLLNQDIEKDHPPECIMIG